MDWTIVATLLVGLGGVLLGGGIQAWHDTVARRREGRSILSALVSEVEALTRLVNHRRFLAYMLQERDACRALVQEGRGNDMVASSRITMIHDYFSLYNALADKIGLLEPYHADRIVRFYSVAKAASENMLAELPPMAASEKLEIVESDIVLLRVFLIIGHEVSGFRQAQGPASVLGPLELDPSLMSDDPKPAISDGSTQ